MSLKNLYEQVLNETVERSKIINAIENKQRLTIYYIGDKTVTRGWRTIEPFCYGVNKFGNPCLRAWQERGVSDSYPPGKNGANGGKVDPLTHIPGWRMFRIDGIKSLSVGWDKFKDPRPKYNPDDKDMTTIYKAAEFPNVTASPNSSKVQPPPVEPKKPSLISKVGNAIGDRFKKLINYKPGK